MTVPFDLNEFLLPGGSVAAGVWLFYRLFIRADRREQSLFEAMKEQRDEWRQRAEDCEDRQHKLSQELAVYRAKYGRLKKEEGK